MSSLPQPVHQQVKLQVNPRKRIWKGTTAVRVIVPPGQQTVGLHCYNLTIHQVAVNSIPAEYTLHQYPAESLPDLTVEHLQKGSGKDAEISSASEYAYDQYIRLMHKEQDPELVIQIPAAVQQQAGPAPATTAEAAGTPAAAAGNATSVKVEDNSTEVPAAAATPQNEAAGQKADSSTPAVTAGTASAPSLAADTPASKPQQLGTSNRLQAQHLTITITFSKPAGSVGRDASLLLSDNCLVANPQLRRARGWFPCLDTPLYIYTAGAAHCIPYTFELQLTVPASFMAVCSGLLLQQTCTVLPAKHSSSASAGHSHASGQQDDAPAVVVARTFEYSVSTPVVPSQISIAVGPFVAMQYSDLLAAVGTPPAASAAGSPVITVFAPVSTQASTPATLVQRDTNTNNGNNMHSSNGNQDNSSSTPPAVSSLSPAHLRRLADTLKPLSVLLRAFEKVLSCMFPWSHLQVAVLPDGTLMKQWQAGLGSIFLQESCFVTDNLVLEPRLTSASCLAAALAQQYFGLLLLPKGPEDIWLLKGLAGWLEGQGLKQLAGSNELLYRRWQERLWLCALDDGEQLGPLSPQVKEGDRGFTAAWGRLHGTQDLDPCSALVWKATAVIHMLERKIGEDELRKVLERYVNGAKHAAANTALSQQPSTPAVPTTPPPAPAAVPTTSGTTAGGTVPPAGHSAGPAAAAAPAAGSVAAASSGVAERLMTTAKFMKTMGKKQGFKKEAPGFFNRWVHGTGIPHLSAGVSWDSKRSLLLLALRQSGSKAVMRGALRASEPVVLGGENTGGAAPGGRACTLKVLVRELDACEEHPLQVDATTPLSLHDIKVTSKLGAQRRRMQAAAAAGARRGNSSWLGGAADDLDVSEAELRGVPVLWVQLDHGMEWLTAVQLQQPAHWWALQLEHSKDVVAQAQSVAGLAHQFGGAGSSPQLDKYIIGVLGAAMRNPGVFCRVRLDAALALGTAAGKYQNNDAAVELFKFVRERLYDVYTGLMLPNDFSDLGEALINHGLPAALAKITMLGGYTPESILAQLLEMLTFSDSSSNPVDDGHWLAALVTALGQLRLSNAAELAKVLKEIDRMLAHESVVGTHNAVLGCACLKAATQLATQVQHAAAPALLDQVKQLLLRYVQPAIAPGSSSSSRRMRATAYGCLLQVAAAASEAELRGMMAGLEAAAAAAAAAAAGNSDGAMIEQQQVQQIAYSASYSHLLQHLLTLTAATDVRPPLLLDAVMNTAVDLLEKEADPVSRADVLKEALLLMGQLEQQGYFMLKPDAVLSDSFRTVVAAEAAAAAAASSGDIMMAELAADNQAAPAAVAAAADEPTGAAVAAAPAEGVAAAKGAAPAGDPASTGLVQVQGTDPPPAAAAAVVAQSQQEQQRRRQQQRPCVVPLSVDVLLRVQQLLNHHDEPAVRQLAFMMLQRLAGHPATLHRERDEDDEDLTAVAAATTAVTAAGHTAAAAGDTAGRGGNAAAAAVSGGGAPSGSMRTGVTGGRARSNMPAASAGGMSVQHTGTTAPTKIKLSGVKLSLKKPPTPAAAGGTTSSAGAAAGTNSSAGAAPPAAAAAAAAGSDLVPGSSTGTATAAAGAREQHQLKVETTVTGAAGAARQTPSSAVSPFAAANQQQQQQGKVACASAAAATAAATTQQQQQVPATVPSVAASVANPPTAAAGTTPAPPAPAAAAAPSTAASATAASPAAVPIRVRPLVKASKLPGSTGDLTGQHNAPLPAAAAAAGGGVAAGGTSSGIRTASASPSPAPIAVTATQQQQQQQLSGVKRPAAAPDVAGQAAAATVGAGAATAAGASAGPPLKKPKFKKNGFPGQLAAGAAATQATAAAATVLPTPAAAGGGVVQGPAGGGAPAASAAAPSASGVTASGVSGAPRKLKFKLPSKK